MSSSNPGTPNGFILIEANLAEQRWTVSSAKLMWQAKNPVSVSAEQRAEVEAFLEALDADDDVQAIYVGLAS